MSDPMKKIVKAVDADTVLKKIKDNNDSVLLTHGHFNVIHPGHLRFLQSAHDKCDHLMVAVLGDQILPNVQKGIFYPQTDRAYGIASLSIVSSVVILDKISLEEIINIIKPKIFLLGKEFESERSDEVNNYVALIKKNNGRVIYSSGEIKYANTDRLFHTQEEIKSSKLKSFYNACNKKNVDFKLLKHKIENFKNLNMLVIGDSIVDQYIACDALGMSAEAPVLAIRELESKEFIGGAAIVACHIKTLGAKCHFLSVIGDDSSGNLLSEKMKEFGVQTKLLVDANRPTTFKIRYMVDNQKLLRVSRLNEDSIDKNMEDQIIDYVQSVASTLDGIVISDFVYGVITKNVLSAIVPLAKKYNIKLFGDLQCSSQVGNVSKFKQFDMICPTEKEARIAMSDHESGIEKLSHNLIESTKSSNLFITLGSEGFIAYQTDNKNEILSQHFPALNANPIDVAGAGDTLLATIAVSLCSGINTMESAALSCCTTAIAVNRIGNQPVYSGELSQYLNDLIQQLYNLELNNNSIN